MDEARDELVNLAECALHDISDASMASAARTFNLDILVRRLQEASNSPDLSGCATMSLQSGYVFCMMPWQGLMKARVRATILRRFGFCHSDELEPLVATSTQTRAEFDGLDLNINFKRRRFTCFLDLVKWVGKSPSDECRHLTDSQLTELIHGVPSWNGNHFTILKAILASIGRDKVADALERTLHPDLTGTSTQTWLCAQSAWHGANLPKIVQSCCSHHNAAFGINLRSFETNVWRWCLNLRAVAEELAPPNADIEPLRWFVETCDADLVQRALTIQLRNFNAQNERVHTTTNRHHAQTKCDLYRRLMIHGLHALRPGLDLGSICTSKILRVISNQRVPADDTIRRTLTLEEAERLVQAARDSNDARATLLFVLLSEIGLRKSALCHLKYNNLLDRTHTPLCTCRAWEKGRKYRFFVTSTRLKQAIKSYAETFRYYADAHPDGDFYMFSPHRPQAPLSASTLSRIISKFVNIVGITDVHVHTHMFRHSIVGWLIDAGNSMELASKYMGHANVTTTSQHYWVPNTTELFSKLNNPFTGEMQQQQREARQAEQELELLQRKLDGALHIIAQMDAVVRTAAAGNLTASQTQEAIARIPNRDAILRTILESTSASLTAASIPALHEPPETIAEDEEASQETDTSDALSETDEEGGSTEEVLDDAEMCKTALFRDERSSCKRRRG